ncbi:DUF6624 domain-containing protein [Niveibacterium terrae]|uniref:DUF6624 domain-containing protein n=1 Tax=Niveibacterium terrae TaxID=3373598 RepID=UPI003A92257D
MKKRNVLLLLSALLIDSTALAGDVVGHVRAHDGQPVVGATVAIGNGTRAPSVTSTDSVGEYRFTDLPAGTYGATATTPDAGAAYKSGIAVAEHGRSEGIELVLDAAAPRIGVRVTSPTGKLPGGLVVFANRWSEDTGDAFYTKAVDGECRLSVIPGSYLVAAKAPGWYGQSQLVKLSGGPARVEFGLYPEKGSEPALSAELIEMEREDQRVRTQYLKEFASKEAQAAIAKVDEKNRQRLVEIVKKFGWPRAELVGYSAEQAAWTLIQHESGQLRKSVLPQLKAAAEAGEIPLNNFALSVDRDLMTDGKKQLYGSQFRENAQGEWELYPVEDEANVDRRRAQMGMEPLADYRAKIARIYGSRASGK